MTPLRHIGEAIAFFLELAVLLAVGAAGFTLPDATVLRVVAGLGAPAVLATLWGLFAAPRAPRQLHGAAGAIFQGAWFATGVVALLLIGRTGLAIALAAVYVVNALVLRGTERAAADARRP